MTDDKIRILIVDDTVTYRKIVATVLADVAGVEVVGTAPNGKIALAKIAHLQPDLLTLDLEMPEMDGLEVLRHLKEAESRVGVIVLSGSSVHGANATMTALKLGAFDFVAKPSADTPEENLRMLRKQLQPRIEAFAEERHIHKARRGGTPPSPIGLPASTTCQDGDISRRMRRISSQPEVIVVGVSTGGPQALSHMLPEIPADLAAPVLIVQHMPPLFTKSLAEDLNRRCALDVFEAGDGQRIFPGQVLIAPGGRQMKVVREDDQPIVRITDDPPENSCRPSVDYLFRSVALSFGANAVGVIMTGMGNDGALGCRQMKQRGATIIAQHESSCVVYGMPRMPIEDGTADIVAPLDAIAGEIVRLAGQGAGAGACR